MHRIAAAIIAFTLCLFGCSSQGSANAPTTSAPASQPSSPNRDPARFAAEIASFEKYDRKNTPPRDPVLFVGSSSIVGWPTAASFPNLTILNRGFGGSTLTDVNHYFDKIVTPYRPRLIVLYAGDNDIALGDSPQQVLAGFRAFVANARRAAPHAPIVYLSNKPSPSRVSFWQKAREANSLIAAECAASGGNLRFVDIATPMLDAHGAPRAELFLADQLHMKDEGYALWTRTVAPFIAELLQ